MSICVIFDIFLINLNETREEFGARGTSENEVIGVLQMIMKPKNPRNDEHITFDENTVNIIGLDEPTDMLINNFAKFISIGMHFLDLTSKIRKSSENIM